MLYLNYNKITSLKQFYYKCFKATLPMYYIAFIYFFIKIVHGTGKFFYKGNPFSLLLTMLGIDGYFHYAMPTIPSYWTCVGEWFLGAIIILYVIYPILLYFVNKKPITTSITVSLLFIWVSFFNRFDILQHYNIIYCLFSFFVGILFFKYKNILDNKYFDLVFSMIFIAFLLVKVPFYYTVNWQIMGITGFVFLYWVGKLLVKFEPFKILFTQLGMISYPMFLLQHLIINDVLYRHTPVGIKDNVLTLFITILLIVAAAYVLYFINKLVLESSVYKDFERFILKS